MTELIIRPCSMCEAKYIEDCLLIEVTLEGKPKLPDKCWREDLIKNIPKSHEVNNSKELH
jgi:hypothetical protein